MTKSFPSTPSIILSMLTSNRLDKLFYNSKNFIANSIVSPFLEFFLHFLPLLQDDYLSKKSLI